MKFPPSNRKTEKIIRLLIDLESNKKTLKLVRPNQTAITDIKRKSILKSSLYSARIEGNPLNHDDLIYSGINRPQTRHALEVSNLLKAYNNLELLVPKHITPLTIKKIHQTVMDGLHYDSGRFRTAESAIYNQAGIAIYIAPAHWKIFKLTGQLCKYINESGDHLLIEAAVSHIWFEKIHPFEDGNGRVGRLISSLILKKGGFDLGGLVPFEQYLDENRQDYYDALNKDSQDVTGFVEFFLFALASQSKKTLEYLKDPPPVKYPGLLPRRTEIMEIITDHKVVTFDFIARRFRNIPERTLHYDLTQLIKSGLVVKLGSTRGTLYTIPDYSR